MQPEDLDTILGLQLTIAWAGEKAESPPRLNWWNTDLTDEAAGADLFQRLLPKTAAWAGFELAREAAVRADRVARSALSQQDRVWTLFHYGFELDEALRDRLEYHKRQGRVPAEVLAASWGVSASWTAAKFDSFLRTFGDVKFKETPAGRKLGAVPANPAGAARLFAAALLPLGDRYPLPHADIPERGDA